MASKNFAVLGDPINHSLSPKIHAAAYQSLGFDYSYEAIQVPANSLAEFIAQRGRSFDGFSVTMPLKFEAAEQSSDQTKLWGTGVANTLTRHGSHWASHNTDIAGIDFALRHCFATNPASAAILGAGATARSALAALRNRAVSRVTIYARDTDKAVALANLLGGSELVLEIKHLAQYSEQQDLTINTLPAGVIESLEMTEPQEGWLLSANYSSAHHFFTDLFPRAQVVSGVEMLLGQAIEQVKLFVAEDLTLDSVQTREVLEAMRAAL
jgi:shikimate dehydrogenase